MSTVETFSLTDSAKQFYVDSRRLRNCNHFSFEVCVCVFLDINKQLLNSFDVSWYGKC